MKQFLLLIFSVVCLSSLTAQNELIFSHTDTVCTIASANDQKLEAKTFIVNKSNSPLNVQWFLTNMAQPSGWETSVCDENGCYPPSILTNVIPGGNPDAPVRLMPGDSSLIYMDAFPNGSRGLGYTQICFTTTEDTSTELGCMTYKFAVGVTSSVEDAPAPMMEIFPNPTTDYFGLTHANSLKEIRVYNMLGRKQRTFAVGQGKKYFVGDMPAGMYLLAFIDKDGKVAKTTRLVKRFFRP